MLDYSRRSTDEQKAITEAFQLLTRLGVFTEQVAVNKAVILERFDQGDPNELAQEILEVRQTNRFLLALHELGQN